MYARIVEGKIRRVFDRLSEGDIRPLVKGLTKDCRHHTGGTHALGGERHSRQATQQWYERLMRLVPGLTFDVDEVHVRACRGTRPSWPAGATTPRSARTPTRTKASTP